MCCFLSIGCVFVGFLYVDEHSEVQAPGRELGNAERLAKDLRRTSGLVCLSNPTYARFTHTPFTVRMR